MKNALQCSRCRVAPVKRYECPKCEQRYSSLKLWNWRQVSIFILRKIYKHQEEHGRGSLPDELKIPTQYYQWIPKKFNGKVYGVRYSEVKQEEVA